MVSAIVNQIWVAVIMLNEILSKGAIEHQNGWGNCIHGWTLRHYRIILIPVLSFVVMRVSMCVAWVIFTVLN